VNDKQVDERKVDRDEEYSDLLLVDILHPDWRHFFSRYKVDILGFLAAWVFVVVIFGITVILTRIGAG